jgi:hypothetical protein
MRIEHELSPLIKKWLKGTKRSPYSAQQTVSKVMKDLSGTAQGQRRRWYFPWRRRSRATARPVAQQDLQSPPITATNGQSPTFTGRTRSMFSPAKAITAGALVFAIGGVLLIAQPFDQQGSSVPGAAIDTERAATEGVTGELRGSDDDCDSDDYCTQEWSMSDPRLEGTFKLFSSEFHDPDSYSVNPVTFSYWAYVIENDGGTWRGFPDVALPNRFGGAPTRDFLMEGEGGYEGLTFVARIDENLDGEPTMRGYIFDCESPLPPDFPSTE